MKFATTLISNSDASTQAYENTAEIMSPKLIEQIRPEGGKFAGGIYNGRIFYALVKDKHLKVFEFGKNEPIFVDQGEFEDGSFFSFDVGGKISFFDYYRPQKLTTFEGFRHRGKEKFAGLHIDLQTNEHTSYHFQKEIRASPISQSDANRSAERA